MRSAFGIAAALAVTAAGGAAAAQEFPADDAFEALRCAGHAVGDAVGDEPGFAAERDVVGTGSTPAAFVARDADDLFLRLRVAGDPGDPAEPDDPAALVDDTAWGFALDLDGDLATYELLAIARGADDAIALHANAATTLIDDPADPADAPEIASYAFADRGRVVVAGSALDGDDDAFVDLAIPWVDLEPLGLAADADVVAWIGTSDEPDRLDGDLACRGGPGGDGRGLSDVMTDSDGDGASDADEDVAGTDPDDPDDVPAGEVDGGELRLEGGGGCAASGSADALAIIIVGLALALARRRAAEFLGLS